VSKVKYLQLFLLSFLFLLIVPFYNQALADTNFQIVTSENRSNFASFINSISHDSSGDIWAVGSSVAAVNSNDRSTLIENCTITNCSIVQSPTNDGSYDPSTNPTGSADLNAVTAVSSNDIWAVGNVGGEFGNVLIEHGTGNTNTSWSTIQAPTVPHALGSTLSNIYAISSNDIWAVGYYVDPTTTLQTLVEHFDGSTWNFVNSLPSGTSAEVLNGVAATSDNNIWAAGSSTSSNFVSTALLKHGTNGGSTWQEYSIPDLPSGALNSSLLGITAVSNTDFYAVGDYTDSSNSPHPVIVHIHFDGTNWIISSSFPSASSGALYSIDASSSNDMWAVGRSLAFHFDGTNWTPVSFPSNTDSNNPSNLYTVSEISSNNIWAAGSLGQCSSQGLCETFVINSLGNTPTPTSIPTVTPTPTPTPLVDFELNRDAYKFSNFDLSQNIGFNAWSVIKAEWAATTATLNPVDFGLDLKNSIITPFIAINYQPQGYCFGLASTSILYTQFPNLIPVFGNSTYQLTVNQAQNNIVEYFYKQFPLQLDSIPTDINGNGDPITEYGTLVDLLKNQHKPAMLNIYGQGSAHSIVAYNIIDNGNIKTVQVYDNNHPYDPLNPSDSNRTATFNLSTNTFNYTDGINVYNKVNVSYPALDFSNNVSESINSAFYAILGWLRTNDFIQIHLHSPVTGLLTDQNGNRFGYVNGQFVNEIPNAKIYHLNDEAVFYVPSTSQYTLTTTGTSAATAGATLGIDITMPTSGTQTKWINYTNIPVSPGSTTTQTINSSSANNIITLSAGGTKNPDEIATMDDSSQTTELPTTIATLSPTHNSDGKYNDPVSVALSASASADLTIANTYYKIDNGSQQTYSAPFSVTGNGDHTITYWSVDSNGNQEAQNTNTFTIKGSYNLTGTIYVDTNQNGFQDTGETGYNGATITLDSGQSTTSDSNGNYSFTNLPAGTYIETLTLPTGYTVTTANPVPVAVAANTTQNFGIVLPIPTATPTPLPTSTPTPTATPTPTVVPTATPTPTVTPTPTPTGTLPVTQDSVGTVQQKVAVTSFSWSHTVGSFTNRILVVGVSVNNGKTVSSVTYGSQNLTRFDSISYESNTQDNEFWYLINPTVGTGTVTVHLSGSAYAVADSASFYNVNQTKPFGIDAKALGNGKTATVTVASGNNQLVLDILGSDTINGNFQPASGQTMLWNGFSDVPQSGASTKASSGTSTTMTWTDSKTDNWAEIGVALFPVSASPTPTPTPTATPTPTPTPTPAPVTQDSVGTVQQKVAVTSFSWSHTVGNNSRRLLIVGISVNNGKTVSSVTYGSQNLTRFDSISYESNTEDNELWYLVNPAVGTGTVTVHLSGSAYAVADSASFYNVNQTTPFGTDSKSSGDGHTATVTVASGINQLVLDVLGSDTIVGDFLPASGQTALWNGFSDVPQSGASTKISSGTSTTMTWTDSKTDNWADIGVALLP